MLSSLHIKNIALIEDITISLEKGLNILSGETGAGKSIIIDSLNFVLGERADKMLIRYGAESASVEAVFEDYINEDIQNYLTEIGIEIEDILIIYRIMSVNGKNMCRINGHSVTLNMLKNLTGLMADIHGQHEHQSLLKTSTHITLLDNFGGLDIKNQLKKVDKAYKDYCSLQNQFKKFGNAEERASKLDILQYQIDELEKADLQPNEEDNLLIQRKKFRNIEKIVNSVTESTSLLNGSVDNFTVISALNQAKNLIKSVLTFDESFIEIEDRLDSAKIEIKDIADTLENLLSELQFDDYTAEKVEKRLELVRSLSHKYGGSVDTAIDFLIKSKEEYDFLNNADEECAMLEADIKKQGDILINECEKLHKLRVKFAKSFEEKINTQLSDLGMNGSRFNVSFTNFDDKTAKICNSNGYDVLEFLISANIGEPMKPLAKIISGGEMSRFMLALKNIIAKLDNINTMVFDEIDTGISGVIAQVVAEKLYNISTDRQVIAVTHLPQLSSMADTHYKITKIVEGNKTNTHLTLLDGEKQIQEIARLIGGNSYSTYAIPHAQEMKQYSNNYKTTLK